MLRKIREKIVVEICNARLKQFAYTFEDPYIREQIMKHCYIAGGAIHSIYNFRAPKDYDIFCDNHELATDILFYMGIEKVQDSVLRYGHANYGNVQFSDNAATIGKFQFVYKFVGEWYSVLAEFDFKHNMYAVRDDMVVDLHGGARRYLTSKKLIFNTLRPRDISGVLLRVPKFIHRGFTITKTEHAKILAKLDTHDINEVSFIEKYTIGQGY